MDEGQSAHAIFLNSVPKPLDNPVFGVYIFLRVKILLDAYVLVEPEKLKCIRLIQVYASGLSIN
jgi:hypothetical protein